MISSSRSIFQDLERTYQIVDELAFKYITIVLILLKKFCKHL